MYLFARNGCSSPPRSRRGARNGSSSSPLGRRRSRNSCSSLRRSRSGVQKLRSKLLFGKAVSVRLFSESLCLATICFAHGYAPARPASAVRCVRNFHSKWPLKECLLLFVCYRHQLLLCSTLLRAWICTGLALAINKY